jgi:hypothetical protein
MNTDSTNIDLTEIDKHAPNRRLSRRPGVLLTMDLVLAVVAVSGCDKKEDDPSPVVFAECTFPMKSEVFSLTRDGGVPEEFSTALPPVSELCIEIKTNASSCKASVDGERVLSPSHCKNEEITDSVILSDLASERHTFEAQLAGTPGDYMDVAFFYRTSGLSVGSKISNADEAMLLAAAYMSKYGGTNDFFDPWKGATPSAVIPLKNTSGDTIAYEVDITGKSGDAGYLVLEAQEGRPLLSMASTEGPSLSQALIEQYELRYGEAPHLEENTVQMLYQGAPYGMGMRVTLPSDEQRLVENCPHCFNTYETLPASLIDENTAQQWRSETIESLLTEYMKATAEFRAESISDPNATGFHTVKGGGAMVPMYNQADLDWDKTDNKDDPCATGCSVIAGLTTMGYWYRQGHTYLLTTDKPGQSINSHLNLIDDTTTLRNEMWTTCTSENEGSTWGWFYGGALEDFIETKMSKSSVSSEWDANTDKDWLIDEPDMRFKTVKDEIDANKVVSIHYRHVEVSPKVDGRHSAVAFGYQDDGTDTKKNALIAVRTGWGTDIPTALIATWGTGWNFFTVLTPGCNQTNFDFCQHYSDVTTNMWSYPYIMRLSCACDVKGYGGGQFGPYNQHTVAEFVTIAGRMFYPDADDFDAIPAYGVPAGQYYTPYMNEANEISMLKKLQDLDLDGVLRPDDVITRVQAAVILAEWGKNAENDNLDALFKVYVDNNECYDEESGSGYPDLTKNMPHMTDYGFFALWAGSRRCLFEGYQNGKIGPFDGLTREQAAKILCIAKYAWGSGMCGSDMVETPQACTVHSASCN